MYTCSCNVFTAEGPFERVTIVSAYRPIHCGKLFFITIYFWLGILLSVSQTNVQQELCDTMDTLLAQMESQNNISRLQVIESPSETARWARVPTKGNYSNQRTPQPRALNLSRPNNSLSNRQHSSKKTCEYCFALGKDEKVWSTHDKLNCYDLFPEKKRTRVNARMLSVPILTDENDTWDLQDALETVENQFYAQSFNSTSEELSSQ